MHAIENKQWDAFACGCRSQTKWSSRIYACKKLRHSIRYFEKLRRIHDKSAICSVDQHQLLKRLNVYLPFKDHNSLYVQYKACYVIPHTTARCIRWRSEVRSSLLNFNKRKTNGTLLYCKKLVMLKLKCYSRSSCLAMLGLKYFTSRLQLLPLQITDVKINNRPFNGQYMPSPLTFAQIKSYPVTWIILSSFTQRKEYLDDEWAKRCVLKKLQN